MELSVTGILTSLLCNRMSDAKLGIVVRGIRQIDPVQIAETVAWTLNRQLAIAVIGYDFAFQTSDNDVSEDGQNGPSLEIATTIETAVTWRNQTSDYAGRILVFVPGEVDKLGSLHSLDILTTRDLTVHLLRWACERAARNAPQRRFWQALEAIAATLPFSMLLDFTRVVAAQPDNVNAIPTELWRLGLLEDSALLNADVDISERLERNRELITAIGQLSDKSRKRMNQVLQRATGERDRELRVSAQQLREFFATGTLVLLQKLRLDSVEQLIEAARPEPEPLLPRLPAGEGEDVGSPSPKPERTLRGSELTEIVANRIVGGRDRDAVAAYVDRVRSQMNNGEEDNGDPIDDETL